jgi:hypothetical protein
MVHLKDRTVDFFSTEAHAKYSTTDEGKRLVALAMSEWEEVLRVRAWHRLERGDPCVHDEMSLGPLVPINNPVGPKFHATPCPNIPMGYDRLYILDLLRCDGVDVTSQEMAATLSCAIVPFDIGRLKRQQANEAKEQKVLDRLRQYKQRQDGNTASEGAKEIPANSRGDDDDNDDAHSASQSDKEMAIEDHQYDLHHGCFEFVRSQHWKQHYNSAYQSDNGYD